MAIKILNFIKKIKLEIIVFLVGATVMILELVGSRILAPYVGTSIFVWTSLIGIILGSLSLGYWWGGKISDKNPNYKTFSLLIFLGGVFIALDTILKTVLFAALYDRVSDIRIESIIAAFVLFSPPSVLLGMISPYAVRLKIKDLANSGATVGNLYAISTIGSIVGTFLAGFFLISYFSNTKLLLILSLTLLFTSLLASMDSKSKTKLALIIFLIFGFAADNLVSDFYAKRGFIDIDTSYNKVWIVDQLDDRSQKLIRVLWLNKESNSAMFINEPGLVFEYAKFYRLAHHFKPGLKKSLLLGGGAYSYPMDYLEKFPEAEIDVVEIDPELAALSKKYFRLKDNPRMAIYHEDGRIFLNKTKNKYDAIFGDAFKSFYSIPYQLTTVEATKKMYDSLNDDGVVIANIISAMGGKKSKFLQAEYATYQSVFPQVYVFPVEDIYDENKLQNIMIVALKSEVKPPFTSNDPELNQYLSRLWTKKIKTSLPVLTDDFAPVDQYMMSII